MTILEVGQKVVLDGVESVVKDRWAQGAYHTYTLLDQRQFNTNIDVWIAEGKLKILPNDTDVPRPSKPRFPLGPRPKDE